MIGRLRIMALPVLFVMLAVGIAALAGKSSPVAAATTLCKAAIVIDRSGSVGDTNLNTEQQQIKNLFAPAPRGIDDPNIQLAFWSFSSTIYTNGVNYDAPFNGFVSSQGGNVGAFNTNLDSIVTEGGTNYEQGFGYHQGVLNSQPGISDVIKNANIIVFMTDGVPNTPGTGDNNATARNAARAAVLKHKAAGKLIAGGIIGDVSQGSLDFVINGNDNDKTNIFHVSSDYTDLTTQLKSIIGQQCSLLIPTVTKHYSLLPMVTTSDRVASGLSTATFSYDVNNSSKTDVSDASDWSVKQLIVDKGQSVAPLYFGNNAYQDNYSCAKLVALVNDNATCTDVAGGQGRSFSPGDTSLNAEAQSATTLTVDDSWPIGTKVCFVLTLAQPTDNPYSPTDRYSRAACLAVGKRPTVQVQGGDLRVGRHFVTDPLASSTDSSGSPNLSPGVSTSVTPKADGRTYGSWVEYGVLAPGPIVGFASLSGLQGGNPSNDQASWSKLTFANSNNQYGFYTPDDSGEGTIPDVASAVLAGRDVTKDLTGVDTVSFNGNGVQSGLYQKSTGNLSIEDSVIAQGKTLVVNVPDGTVTINGNIGYDNGPYTDISQIPQMVIIAKRIEIAPSVVNVSAWLIANSAEDGIISTCNDPGTLTIQMCNQQLTINGPVMANHLQLRRTGGAGVGDAAGDAAEIINLPVNSYLWSQSAGHSDIKAETSFTTELPPYF